MVIKLKVASHNGAPIVDTYETVKDAKRYLNEASYYAEKVWISSSFHDFMEYTSKTSLAALMADAKRYGDGFIHVSIEF